MRHLLEDRDGDGVPDGLQAFARLQHAQWERAEASAKAEEQVVALSQAEAALSRCRAARPHPLSALFIACVLAMVVSFPYHQVFVRWLGLDPWFGAHQQLFCPMVCDGCHGPYAILAWTAYSTPTENSGESTRVYCRPPGDHAVRFGIADISANREYEVPGSTYLLWLSSIPLLFVLFVPVGFVVNVAMVMVARQKAPHLEARVAALRRAQTPTHG